MGSTKDGWLAAVEAAGTVTALAKLLGESVQAVNNWGSRGIPAKHCRAIERLTGVSVKLLRPNDWQDYWPEPPVEGDLRQEERRKRSNPSEIVSPQAKEILADLGIEEERRHQTRRRDEH